MPHLIIKTDEFHPPKIDWLADDKICYKKFYCKATAEKTSPMLVVSIQTIKLIYMKKYNHSASWLALTSVTFIFVVLVSVLNQACRKMEVVPGNQAALAANQAVQSSQRTSRVSLRDYEQV